jgi:hypothetical protein
MTVFRTARGRAAPLGREEMDVGESTSELHTSLEGEVVEEIRDFLE